MKTKINTRNLKKLAITACATLMINAGSFTQLRAEGYDNEYLASQVGLETLVNSIEQSIRYNAAEVNETTDLTAEMERLENLAATTEASLQYIAPKGDEADALTPELERIETLAAATEASLRYNAPAGDEEFEVTPELERIEMLSAATEASLKYRAPEGIEPDESIDCNFNSAAITLAGKVSNQLK